MRLTLVTAPAAEPVTEALMREHATLDSAVPQSIVLMYIAAARRQAEWLTGRALITQTWDQFYDDWPLDGWFELGRGPVQSVTTVKYFDPLGTEQTLNATNYRLLKVPEPGYVELIDNFSAPSLQVRSNGITIRFVAGYGADGTAVPDDVNNWILARAATALDNRESVDRSGKLQSIPYLDELLQPYKLNWAV